VPPQTPEDGHDVTLTRNVKAIVCETQAFRFGECSGARPCGLGRLGEEIESSDSGAAFQKRVDESKAQPKAAAGDDDRALR